VPIADDLREIAGRTNRELDAVHDFYEHSKVVWRSFQLLVSAGHPVSSVNAETGTSIDGAGLVGLARQYAREYLAAFTFRQFVSTFESFFFAFLHRVLRHNPWPFARRQLEFDAVLRARDRDEIIAGVLLKQLDELKYENVRGWFDALNRAVKLGCPTDQEADALAEVKAVRDVLEHNAGVVNDIYVRKAGAKARYAAGDRVEIDGGYHLESWRLIKKVVADLTAAAATKLA
jgi:hypothetical protein